MSCCKQLELKRYPFILQNELKSYLSVLKKHLILSNPLLNVFPQPWVTSAAQQMLSKYKKKIDRKIQTFAEQLMDF